jgi:hypothetical protein
MCDRNVLPHTSALPAPGPVRGLKFRADSSIVITALQLGGLQDDGDGLYRRDRWRWGCGVGLAKGIARSDGAPDRRRRKVPPRTCAGTVPRRRSSGHLGVVQTTGAFARVRQSLRAPPAPARLTTHPVRERSCGYEDMLPAGFPFSTETGENPVGNHARADRIAIGPRDMRRVAA